MSLEILNDTTIDGIDTDYKDIQKTYGTEKVSPDTEEESSSNSSGCSCSFLETSK